MKFLKKVILSLLFLFVVLTLVSFFLPQKQHVERNVEISASAEKIYPYLINPKLFNEWSPWSKLDPDMKVQFTGPESGIGAGMSWQSNQSDVGNGSWKIIKTVENESLVTALDFGDQGTATSFFRLQPKDGKTQVTWGFDTDAGMNPMKRWFGLLMDSMVGEAYQKGLQSLKVLVEPP
ncbi:MAG: SRPBCC family protein [Thiotrichaceae bacterium]